LELIPRGLARSYGDSSLAPLVIETDRLDHFLDFDEQTGLLRCGAGVSLAEILEVFVPRGWFLPVTPGTKFVTVGGAIASDVHGKNHHLEGTFCDHVTRMRVATPATGIVECSRDDHHPLFLGTCGGMGLTGIIVDATFRLRPIASAYIDSTTLRASNLTEALDLFLEHDKTTYSVAWIDCLARGRSLGRSLLTIGEHATSGDLVAKGPRSLAVPVDLPGQLLNRFTVQGFNSLYYRRVREARTEQVVHYEPFFYPLDFVHQWNRIYGRGGFTQYQFVVPRVGGVDALTEVLDRISASRRASFLAVLKSFGPANDNYLSFPMEGYTLALDFKIEPGLFDLLDTLDEVVLEAGGRLYLTKDVRMSAETFRRSYPRWPEMEALRRQYGADQVFNSRQSQRLGL
jgi:FAD/FMN-containing dehydrogenase